MGTDPPRNPGAHWQRLATGRRWHCVLKNAQYILAVVAAPLHFSAVHILEKKTFKSKLIYEYIILRKEKKRRKI